VKTDSELQDDVVQELRWDPQVAEPDHIGVAAADGAVTLTGHTTTYAEKLAAARAAERVYRVRTVANDLQVRLAGSPRTTPTSPGRSPTSWSGTCRSRPAACRRGCRTAG
jgi:osmotically-inducible protein OsmY